MEFSTMGKMTNQRISTAVWDNGYADQKGIVKNEVLLYPSKIEKYNGMKFTDESIVVEYEGEEYILATGNQSLDANKTSNLHHKIMTLAGIGLVSDYEEIFNLVVALPMNNFKNKDFREKFKEYMNSYKNTITVNGKKKHIYINDVTVFMQGSAGLYSNPERFKNKIVGLIDIGGKTINACIFENLNPILDTMTTINLGTLILDNRIKSALNDNHFIEAKDFEIPYLINKEEYKKTVDEVINKYFEDIKYELIAKGWNLDTLPKYGIGGGMLKLENHIKRYLSNIEISEDPQFENVKGLQVIGEMIYGI